MERWLRKLVAVCAMAMVLSALGCGEPSEADISGAVDERPTQRVEANEEVTVLARQGAVTLVRTAGGATGFVPNDQLRIDGQGGVVTVASELDWQPPPKSEAVPRPILEINRARNQVETLYLSTDGSQEFMRPTLLGPFVDPKSGQTCWPAFTCTAKDCPGVRTATGHTAFPGVMAGLRYSPDGSSVVGTSQSPLPTCPACGSKINVRRYATSETAAEMQKLSDERRRRLRWMRKNKPWLDKDQ